MTSKSQHDQHQQQLEQILWRNRNYLWVLDMQENTIQLDMCFVQTDRKEKQDKVFHFVSEKTLIR